MSAQLDFFVDAGQVASLEQTMIDLGTDVAAAFDAQRAEIAALRTRLMTAERLAMQLCKADSEIGDRLRRIELHVGIKPGRALSAHAMSREVAA